MKDLVDSFNRRINYLRVSITDRCNLRCVYCMPIDGIPKVNQKDILSYEEILRIVEVAVKNGITKIRITGGEPLVRKGVIDFVRSLSRIHGVKDLSLTTNGILLRDFAGDLFDAGLHRVNISMDSLNNMKFQKITGGGNLEKVCEGIEEALRVGFSPVKINTVIIHGFNDDEVIDFARLSINNPYHIRFIELMPIGSNSKWSEERYISSQEVKDKIESFRKLHPIHKKGERAAARMFRFEGAMGEIGFISPMSAHFCSSCNRLRLTANGKLRTCLFSNEEVDLKPSLRESYDNSGLERLIDLAISNKPEKHHLGEKNPKKCTRNMSDIGG
ncbi:MAG: GTP 3',8-cyclase MoaA [Desulfobacteria bacterium]